MTILDYWLIYSVIGAAVVLEDYYGDTNSYRMIFRWQPYWSTLRLALTIAVLWLPLLISEWRNHDDT